MSASTRRWLLLALIAAAIVAFFVFDLDQMLTLDALRAQRAALASTIAAQPLLSAGIYFAVYVLVTALSPVIGYDKASKIAHYAMDNDLTLKAAALKLGFVSEAEFDRVVDPAKMANPHVAADR